MHTIPTNQQYPFLHNDFVIVEDGMLAAPPDLLYDKWEEFDERKLEEYFEKSYGIFMSRLQEFREAKHQLTTKEEKELKFMLEALIDVKKSLREMEK